MSPNAWECPLPSGTYWVPLHDGAQWYLVSFRDARCPAMPMSAHQCPLLLSRAYCPEVPSSCRSHHFVPLPSSQPCPKPTNSLEILLLQPRKITLLMNNFHLLFFSDKTYSQSRFCSKRNKKADWCPQGNPSKTPGNRHWKRCCIEINQDNLLSVYSL